MCVRCCKEAHVGRERTCLDDGCYFANFNGCAGCGSSALPTARRRVVQEEEEDNNETVEETEFDHECDACGHVAARHYHKFASDASARRWLMECALCGHGLDERPSIMSFSTRAKADDDLEMRAAAPANDAALDAQALDAGSSHFLEKAAKAAALQRAEAETDVDDDEDWR